MLAWVLTQMLSLNKAKREDFNPPPIRFVEDRLKHLRVPNEINIHVILSRSEAEVKNLRFFVATLLRMTNLTFC